VIPSEPITHFTTTLPELLKIIAFKHVVQTMAATSKGIPFTHRHIAEGAGCHPLAE
jgi:hypothetical protein